MRVFLQGVGVGGGESVFETEIIFNEIASNVDEAYNLINSSCPKYGDGVCSIIYNGELYVFGGYTAASGSTKSKTVAIYNFETQLWRNLSVTGMTSDVWGCVLIGNTIWLSVGSQSGIMAYYPDTGGVGELILPDIDGQSYYFANRMIANVDEEGIYLVGSKSVSPAGRTIIYYHFATGIWSLIANIPEVSKAMYNVGCAGLGSNIYITTGTYGSYRPILIFNIETSEFETSPAQDANYANAQGNRCIFKSSDLHVIGPQYHNVFNIGTYLWQRRGDLPKTTTNPGVSLNKNIQIVCGVDSVRRNTVYEYIDPESVKVYPLYGVGNGMFDKDVLINGIVNSANNKFTFSGLTYIEFVENNTSGRIRVQNQPTVIIDRL